MRTFSRLWNSFQWIEKILLFGCAMALLFFAGGAWSRYRTLESLPPIFEEATTLEIGAHAEEGAPEGLAIQVHVAGEVKQAGVVTLPPASRVSDAIQAVGGARPEADLEALNLAQKLQDGEKVFVPHRSAARENEPAAVQAAGSTSAAQKPSGKKAPPRAVNVNKASAAELETLPGVGPITAERIIEERTQKPFANLADLERVKGLGPKKLEKIAPYVTF